jgi:DNA topoisomerase IB
VLEELAFDKASARRTDENGFLHVEMTNISKATVNPYYGKEIPGADALGLSPDKIYKLLRDPKHLAEGASTFNNLPVLDKHIPVSAIDLNDPEIKKHVVGSTGTEAVYEAPYLKNSMVLYTASAIADVQKGFKAELSCAYRYVPVMTPGTFEGQHYDGIMTNLRGNHLALVVEGRAGHDVKVMDAKLQFVEFDYQKISGALGIDTVQDQKLRMALGMDYLKEQVRDDKGRWALGTGQSGGGTATKSGKSEKEGGKGVVITYRDARGKPLSEALQKQAAEAKVPPGYVNIHLPKFKDDPIKWKAQRWVPPQGSKPGRWKWEQKASANHDSKAAKQKFARTKSLANDIPKLDKAASAGSAKGDHTAAAVRLMLLTGLRVGGKDSAERTFSHTVKSEVKGEKGTKVEQEGHFGISTLQKEHVRINGDKVSLSFNGKHGVSNERTITDKASAKFLKERLAGLKKGDPVFNTNQAKTMKFIEKTTGNKYENKDLRTYQGTKKAVELIGRRTAKTEKELLALQKEVSKGVSQHLCNSPKMALERYIDPAVWKTIAPMVKLSDKKGKK